MTRLGINAFDQLTADALKPKLGVSEILPRNSNIALTTDVSPELRLVRQSLQSIAVVESYTSNFKAISRKAVACRIHHSPVAGLCVTSCHNAIPVKIFRRLVYISSGQLYRLSLLMPIADPTMTVRSTAEACL